MEIKTFDWLELAGKTLDIVVVCDERICIISGRDVKTGKYYVIAEQEVHNG
jgi:hypothetical protein